jgi:uncharacterized membrane protein
VNVLKVYFQDLDKQKLFDVIVYSFIAGVVVAISIVLSLYVVAWIVGVLA